MHICGFSFLRNGVRFDYPFVESIKSVLPICDEFIIAIGKGQDDTRVRVEAIGSTKIKIVDTIWDKRVEPGYAVLAHETDKAFQAIPQYADWALYIQGDEVLHEQYHARVLKAMHHYQHKKQIDGLLFNYLHFYGSYDYVGTADDWYAHEIRIIRNRKDIFSYRDAQGFRKRPNEKLCVALIDAYIYHYGWVREPKALSQKQEQFDMFMGKTSKKYGMQTKLTPDFDYAKHPTTLKPFQGTHPAVMQERIQRKNWTFRVNISIQKRSLKSIVKQFALRYLGLNFYYTNYKLKDV